MINRRFAIARGVRGLSLLEVLVAAGIMTAGLLSILAIFPFTLRAQRDAEMLSKAISLAQFKAEEIRRDDSSSRRLVRSIRQLTEPTSPVAFPSEPRLTYSFSGRTLLYLDVDATDPRGTDGVARVIVRYTPEYRASQDVIYELRFN